MTTALENFLMNVKNGVPLTFEQTIAVIDKYYHYQPTAFCNGNHQNPEGKNEGSCKIFAFAKLHHLNETQTLALFGEYYRVDVLENPNGTDHQNIRQFMQYGWAGILFENASTLIMNVIN